MEREDICTIMARRHGTKGTAYLILFNQNAQGWEYAGPDDLADAASTLATAKRVAKEGAKESAYTHLRWAADEDGRRWELSGVPPAEDADRY